MEVHADVLQYGLVDLSCELVRNEKTLQTEVYWALCRHYLAGPEALSLQDSMLGCSG